MDEKVKSIERFVKFIHPLDEFYTSSDELCATDEQFLLFSCVILLTRIFYLRIFLYAYILLIFI